MKVTLEVSEEVLAAIWSDTWQDKLPESMVERLQDVIEDRAIRYFDAFPRANAPSARAALVEKYRQSPHCLKPE